MDTAETGKTCRVPVAFKWLISPKDTQSGSRVWPMSHCKVSNPLSLIQLAKKRCRAEVAMSIRNLTG